MTLNEFQIKTYANLRPIDVPMLLYVSNALAGEVGECANIVKKLYRDGDTDARREALKLEIGDSLHYLADLAAVVGFSLEDVARANFIKLGIPHGD